MDAERQDWWNANLPMRSEDFAQWLTGPMDETRMPVRGIVEREGRKSVLDVGCGLCTERDGFIRDKYEVCYVGVDSCRYLVRAALKVGHPAVLGCADNLPFPDDAFESVMCRGVIEHLEHWRPALEEMMRVTLGDVLVSWFLPPQECESKNHTVENGGVLWHNTHSRPEIETWLSELGCVWNWHPLPRDFELLRIEKHGH